MATGLSTKLKFSEEMFKYTCSVCRKKNQVREAVKHCQDCQKDLCTSCLQQHNDYMVFMLEDHSLVEPSAARTGTVMPTEKCRHHGQKVMELWCKNHDEILCSTCVIKNHRSCEGVKFIGENIDDLLQDTNLQETIKALKNTRERLKTLKDEQGLAEEELLNEKNKYLNMVEQHKKKIISIVESLEKAAVEEIKVWYNERKCKMSKEQDCCDQLEREATTYIQQLDSSSDNKPQLFVFMKKGQRLLATIKTLNGQREMKLDEEYEISHDIIKHLSSVKSFGSFQKQIHLYKATGMRKFSVEVSKDQSTCNITDVCILPDRSILVTDSSNSKLKRLNSSTYTVTDQCGLPGHPWAVCCVGPEEVVVSLGKSNKVQFVSISNKMSLSMSIALSHWCCGVGYSDGELFVSDSGKNVFVYNMAGTLLRIIGLTPSGQAMFSYARHLAVNGDRIYIVDRGSKLNHTDKNETEMYRYKCTQIKNGWGVCTDGRRGAFLCGFNSPNVVQIGADGEELGVVLTKADSLNYPKSICFNPSSQTLIVTNSNSNEILLFNLV